MKLPLLYTLLIAGLLATACHCDCGQTNSKCKEKPPEGEVCDAAFNRWFYIKSMNACQQISYSGCNAKGFDTKEDCEACKCD